jgi:hypothetical protein
MNNNLTNNNLMNNNNLIVNSDENINHNVHNLYDTFKSQKVKRKYYKNDSDFYFYTKIYFYLDKKGIKLPFYNSNEINFTLVMTILMNDLFGDYEFYQSFIMLFSDPQNTYYNIINNIYNEANLKVGKFDIIFKQSLLEYRHCKDLYKIKSEFFNLNFNKKYSILMFHSSKIKTLFFISSFLEHLSLDKEFFLNNSDNSSFTANNKYDLFFLKNYYFKSFINISNVKELYASFLNYDNMTTSNNSNTKIKTETDFLFFEDLNKKFIISKHANGHGVFSKKFKVSLKKHGNLMISFFRKKGDDIELCNVQKYIPYVNDKTKIAHMSVPKSSLGSIINMKYNKEQKSYDFYEFTLKKGVFSDDAVKIHLSYMTETKMIIIVIDNERIENQYYLLKGKSIIRFLKNTKKFSIIAKFKHTKTDLICDILQIILPFEYIIIQVILYFECNQQSGGGLMDMYKKLKGNTPSTSDTADASLEQKLLNEIGKPPSKSITDFKLLNLFKKNKLGLKETVKKTDKLLKNSNLSNLVTNLSDTSFDFKTSEYDETADFTSELEQYPIDDKNECLQSVVRDTDSWLFQYYFYKAKYNECQYYYEGFEKYFKAKNKEINNNQALNYEGMLESIKTKASLNEKSALKNKYITALQDVAANPIYFNELLMMAQFNKDWLDNYIS